MMKAFRPGASIWPLLLWAFLASGAAFGIERHAIAKAPGPGSALPYHLIAAGLVVLGPLAFVAHAIRRRLVWVAVDAEQGLLLRDRALVPWQEIRSIERWAGLFRKTFILQGFADPDGFTRLLEAVGLLAIPLLLGLALVTFLYFILLPAFSLLSPWSPRVTVTLTDGERLVWRDLEEDEEFVRWVRRGIDRRELAA